MARCFRVAAAVAALGDAATETMEGAAPFVGPLADGDGLDEDGADEDGLDGDELDARGADGDELDGGADALLASASLGALGVAAGSRSALDPLSTQASARSAAGKNRHQSEQLIAERTLQLRPSHAPTSRQKPANVRRTLAHRRLDAAFQKARWTAPKGARAPARLGGASRGNPEHRMTPADARSRTTRSPAAARLVPFPALTQPTSCQRAALVRFEVCPFAVGLELSAITSNCTLCGCIFVGGVAGSNEGLPVGVPARS